LYIALKQHLSGEIIDTNEVDFRFSEQDQDSALEKVKQAAILYDRKNSLAPPLNGKGGAPYSTLI
jgi:hypothetical protein